ncbi:MAG: cell division protein ZipA [Chromatiaceae bacterium]|nr:cell division protein ZipA [Chromatiaceae bacterium]
MDADLLRIILAVLGALVIAGLYYWEQRRRHRDEDVEEADPDELDHQGSDAGGGRPKADRDNIDTKREPRLGVWGQDDGDLDAEEGEGVEGDPGLQSRGRAEATHFNFFKPDPDLAEESFPPGPMLLVLHVAARGPHFEGASIVHAARIAGLEPGDQEIFHCKLGDEHHTETLFSMVNMVKPGTFPFGAMAEFETPGLTLFAQIDGQAGDPGRLEELLGTAHSLANDLGGELRDDRRQPLTAEGEERLRQRVMAFITHRMAE